MGRRITYQGITYEIDEFQYITDPIGGEAHIDPKIKNDRGFIASNNLYDSLAYCVFAPPNSFTQIATRDKDSVSQIVVHSTFSSPTNRFTVHEYHKETRGFVGFGYHYLILLDGAGVGTYDGQDLGEYYNELYGSTDGLVELGRPWWVVGEHVYMENTKSMGVAVVSPSTTILDDYTAILSSSQQDSLVQLLAELLLYFDLPLEALKTHYSRLVPHNLGKEYDVDTPMEPGVVDLSTYGWTWDENALEPFVLAPGDIKEIEIRPFPMNINTIKIVYDAADDIDFSAEIIVENWDRSTNTYTYTTDHWEDDPKTAVLTSGTLAGMARYKYTLRLQHSAAASISVSKIILDTGFVFDVPRGYHLFYDPDDNKWKVLQKWCPGFPLDSTRDGGPSLVSRVGDRLSELLGDPDICTEPASSDVINSQSSKPLIFNV